MASAPSLANAMAVVGKSGAKPAAETTANYRLSLCTERLCACMHSQVFLGLELMLSMFSPIQIPINSCYWHQFEHHIVSIYWCNQKVRNTSRRAGACGEETAQLPTPSQAGSWALWGVQSRPARAAGDNGRDEDTVPKQEQRRDGVGVEDSLQPLLSQEATFCLCCPSSGRFSLGSPAASWPWSWWRSSPGS